MKHLSGFRTSCWCAFVLAGFAFSSAPVNAFKIQFDYRFANGYFDDPVKRKALEDAAAFLEDAIADDFPAVPAGTVIKLRHRETRKLVNVTLEKEIDDFLVFVFASDRGKKGRKASAKPIGRRMKGDNYRRRFRKLPFQPWTAMIHFNTNGGRPWFFDPTPQTSADIPSQTHYDFIGTAIHELLHALGLQSSVRPHRHWVKDNYFHGPKAMAVNGGKPIPLKKKSSHIRKGFANSLPRPHIDNFSIHTGKHFQGLRHMPTALELAMLSDLGYTIRHIKNLRLPDQIAPKDPRRDSMNTTCRVTRRGGAKASGLWHFDRPEFWGSAIVGNPLHYMSNKAGQPMTPTDSGARVPRGAYLMLDHGIAPDPGRRRVNRYTLVMEIRIPEHGRTYALFNTNKRNRNSAEALISEDGKLGQGNYSEARLKAGEWHQVALSVDTIADERRYFLDGRQVLKQRTDGVDSRHALRSVVLAFADRRGRDGAIDVRRIAIYPAALSENAVKHLTARKWACTE